MDTTTDKIKAAMQEQADIMGKRLGLGAPIPDDEVPVTLDLVVCEAELMRYSTVGMREYFRTLRGLATSFRYNGVPARVTLLSGEDVPCNHHEMKHVFRFETFGDPEVVREILDWKKRLPDYVMSSLMDQFPEPVETQDPLDTDLDDPLPPRTCGDGDICEVCQ